MSSDDNSSHGRRDHEVDGTSTKFSCYFVSQRAAQGGTAARIHHHPGTLQIDRTVQTRAEQKVAFEQGARIAEVLQDFVSGHARTRSTL